MLVNVHFVFSSLFASLTTAYGSNGKLKGNPVIPALMGVTDQFLVQITAAACVIQYLLTCAPEENVESSENCMNLSTESIVEIRMYVTLHEETKHNAQKLDFFLMRPLPSMTFELLILQI